MEGVALAAFPISIWIGPEFASPLDVLSSLDRVPVSLDPPEDIEKIDMPSSFEISGDIAPGPVSIDQINAAATQATAFSSVKESSKLFVLRVSSDDIRKLLSNAIEKADKPRLGWYPDSLEVGSAYPYASGLRYQVDLTREPGQKVFGLELLLRNENKWVPFDSPDRPSYVVMTTERALDDFGYMQDIVPIDKTTPGSLSFVDLVVTSLGYSSEWEPPLEDKMSTASFVSGGGKS